MFRLVSTVLYQKPEVVILVYRLDINNTWAWPGFFKGGVGHTESCRGYSPNCHLNIVGCLLTKRLTKGGGHMHSRTPLVTPLQCYYCVKACLSPLLNVLLSLYVAGCIALAAMTAKLLRLSAQIKRNECPKSFCNEQS